MDKKERLKRWRQANKEKIKDYAQRYHQKYKEKIKEYQKKYFQDHKEQRRSYKKRATYQLKIEILTYYSGGIPRCARCGIEDINVLCIDHIEGGGEKQRREIGVRSGYKFYLWLKRNGYPKGFQVLCANCNLKKLIEEGT